jgi:4-amino-4-deoxy-L-arabinose transferase-like glycosyltransferase
MAVIGKLAAPSGSGGARSLRASVRPLLVICVIALVVRLIVVFATPHFQPIADSSEYDQSAVSLVSNGTFGESVATFHGGPTAYHPPLFSVALAGVYGVVGTGSAKHRWEAGRIFEAVLGAIAVGLIFLIALALWDPVIAVIAASIAAVYPPLVLVGSSLMSESLFIPLALGAVLAGLRAREHPSSWLWPVLAGVLAGLAALTRETGVPLLVVLCWLAWSGRPRFSRRALRAPLLVLGAAVVVLIPWTVRNEHEFGRFEPVTTGTGYALAGAYDHQAQTSKRFPALWAAPFADVAKVLHADPTANEAQISSGLTTMAVHYIEHNPGSVLKTAYWSTLRLLDLTGPGFERWFAPYEGYPRWLAGISVYAFWLIALLAIAGVFTSAVRRAPRAFWACPVIMFLSCVPFEGDTRYRSPVDPFLLILAAFALRSAWQRRRGGERARRDVGATSAVERLGTSA